jgi:hypothetical protein
MARFTHNRSALEPDQAAALRHLVAAVGVEQVTVTDVQPHQPARSGPGTHPDTCAADAG